MRELDLTSILVAAAIGAVLLTLVSQFSIASTGTPGASTTSTIITGAAVGAGVQIGVRLFGVS